MNWAGTLGNFYRCVDQASPGTTIISDLPPFDTECAFETAFSALHPVPVHPDLQFVQLVAGEEHVCGILWGGSSRTVCWVRGGGGWCCMELVA